MTVKEQSKVQNLLERRQARALPQCHQSQVQGPEQRRVLWKRPSLLGRRSSSLRRRVLLLLPLVAKKLQPAARKVKRGSQKKRTRSNQRRKEMQVKAMIT